MTARQQLLTYADQHRLTVTELMNILQEHGAISDNCIGFSDIPECDAVRAMTWLREKKLF